MKKVFYILSAIFAVGLSSLLLFTTVDQKIFLYLQKIIPEREPAVPLVLVPVSDSDFSDDFSPFSAQSKENIRILARELGCKDVVFDSDDKNSFVYIDPLVEKVKAGVEKKAPLFNFKIVFPSKDLLCADTKTPSAFKNINSKNLPYSFHLVAKKGGKYYAASAFSQSLDLLGSPELRVSDSALLLKNVSLHDGNSSISVKIPRLSDGSIALNYPKKSWSEYKNVSFSRFYNLLTLEKNLYEKLNLMSEQGFFFELKSESPLDVLNSALRAKKSRNENEYFFYKKKFFVLMSAFLSGNQERSLCEASSDEKNLVFIKDSFDSCRKLFAEIETLRVKLSDSIQNSFCVFALCSDSQVDFISSPFDEHFPASLVSYVVLNMILARDFVFFCPNWISLAVAAVFCLIFILLACRIKKNVLMILFSVLLIFFMSCALIFALVHFSVFAGISIPLASIFILALILNQYHFAESRQKVFEQTQLFSQQIPPLLLKKINTLPADSINSGEKIEVSVLSTSIHGRDSLTSVLNEVQFAAFMNYYFEKISSAVIKFNGIIESYRDDEVISLFGAPVFDQNHCASAVNAAREIKNLDKAMNGDIQTFPKSPKPEGMNDDLYTAFFILNHNCIKILTDAGIWSGKAFCVCMGSYSKKSYRISDFSWKNSVELKNFGAKIEASGIIIDENTADFVKNDYILRKICSVHEENSKTVCEVLDSLSSDDDKLWNYANYWNQATDLLKKGEKSKALAIFLKLLEGRPDDNIARYSIKQLNTVE